MNDWGGVFLGVIALAVTVMAVVQVGVIVFGARLARRVEQLVVQIDRDIKPLVANLNVMSQEAARAAELATAQVQRVDQLFGDIASRVEETADTPAGRDHHAGPRGHGARPGREGRLRRPAGDPVRHRTIRAARHDEDDALFIG